MRDDYQSMSAGPSPLQKALIYFFWIGMFAGSALVTGYGLAFEWLIMPSLRVPGAPFLSYGQQAFVMIVVAGCVCGAAGAGIVLAKYKRWLASAAIVLGACALVSVFVGWRWLDDIAHWGHDPSAYILYWPFVVLLPVVVIV